jgi:hypothetical protein
MLFDSPWLLLFVLAFASVLRGLVAAESEVEPPDGAGDKKEVADEVIIQGVIEAKHEYRHDSLEYLKECAQLDKGSRLINLLLNLFFDLVDKHSNNREETCALLANSI